jgi:Tfp pilus assembly protein PilO
MYKRIVAAAIIILIAFVYVQWGMDYIYAYEWEKTAPDRESLVNEIENIKKIVTRPFTFDDTLAQRLAELESQIETEKEKFPEDIYITDVVDELLHLAEDTGIGIIPLRNGEWTKAREKNYEKYQIQLLLTGDIDDIVEFVDQVEAKMLHSINVENLEVRGDSIGPAGGVLEAGSVEGYVTITVFKRA